MPPHPALIDFRDWLVSEYQGDRTLERVAVLEGADAAGGDLAVRLCTANKSYYDVRVQGEPPEVEVGLATESRVVNEAVEQMVLDNGGDLSELLGDELCDLGEEPLPMDHFFERPAFRYVVRLELTDARDLAEPALRKRVLTILSACRILFQESVENA